MTETKKDWRRDSLATRIDLRMPNEVYDRVIEIATASGEKINPKTNQVRVTATLNKLIEIGIRHLSDDNQTDASNVREPSDIVGLEIMYKELSDKYQILETKLSDTYPIEPDTISTGLSRDDVEAMVKMNVEPLADLLGELEAYTQAQFEAVRDDLKKPLAIAL